MPFEWNNLLVVSVDELVPAHYKSDATLRSEIYRYANLDFGIKKVRRGGNGSKMLILFDSLSREIRNAIGDPRKISNPLEMYYKVDAEATRFYTKDFKFNDSTRLSLQHQSEYIVNASVLRAAICLKEAREYERRSKGGSLKGIMTTICNDVAAFNKILATKHNQQHTLPASEKRFKETFKEFANGFNYTSLISAKLGNQNRRVVTDDLLQLLNDLFSDRSQKPTRTEVSRRYEAFLNGYVEVINPDTGEQYNPANYKPLSDNTIVSYLGKWSEAITTHRLRSGDRQRYMGQYKTYHSLDKPAFAGSIISIDDRNPPFKYDATNRVWFYNGIDLGSEAWICYVHGKSKEGIITEFYRQLVRNYHAWGVNLPAELECESALNSSFTNTFLQEGRMFDHVRIEANNARGKRIERYFSNLRYSNEKQREGWLARPHARSEANRVGNQQVPIIPYKQIVDGCLKDIEDWNNSPHSVHTDKTRWEVFMEMQHPDLKPINWHGILPYLGYKTQTSCQLNGIIHLDNHEYLLGNDGQVLLGDKLIKMMSLVAGRELDIYWLDDINGRIIKAIIFLRNQSTPICEAVLKPRYQRATIEQTDKDKSAREIMSAYVNSIEAYASRKSKEISELVIIDNTPKQLNRKFRIDGLDRPYDFSRETEILPEVTEEIQITELPASTLRSLKDRY
ncbi:MAG TPA: hypothetical protein PKE30_13135 [Niabella sp.]|nr:hypothetical protein [Niabella sp.]